MNSVTDVCYKICQYIQLKGKNPKDCLCIHELFLYLPSNSFMFSQSLIIITRFLEWTSRNEMF